MKYFLSSKGKDKLRCFSQLGIIYGRDTFHCQLLFVKKSTHVESRNKSSTIYARVSVLASINCCSVFYIIGLDYWKLCSAWQILSHGRKLVSSAALCSFYDFIVDTWCDLVQGHWDGISRSRCGSWERGIAN